MPSKVFGLDSLAEYACSMAMYKNVHPSQMTAVMANRIPLVDKGVKTYHESMGLKNG